jgi:hypothetical protein
VTLRVGTQLVALRADTHETLTRLRALLAAWIDDTPRDVPWVFDVRLDTSRNRAGVGPRPVPQLRLGQVLMARSRDPDDILRALAHVLGGVLARQDDTAVWSAMRAFAGDGHVVLVDARPPTLSADPVLARAGIVELPTWCVAIDGPTVRVPPPLDRLDWTVAAMDPPEKSTTAWRTQEFAGIVALDPAPLVHDRDGGDDQDHATPSETIGPAALLSRFAVRHPSSSWFSAVDRLVRDGRVSTTTDRSVARRHIVELVDR